MTTCIACNGAGEVWIKTVDMPTHEDPKRVTCEACRGNGEVAIYTNLEEARQAHLDDVVAPMADTFRADLRQTGSMGPFPDEVVQATIASLARELREPHTTADLIASTLDGILDDIDGLELTDNWRVRDLKAHVDEARRLLDVWHAETHEPSPSDVLAAITRNGLRIERVAAEVGTLVENAERRSQPRNTLTQIHEAIRQERAQLVNWLRSDAARRALMEGDLVEAIGRGDYWNE